MAMSQVRKRLEKAHRDQTLVRVRRGQLTGGSSIDGYVVSVADRWVVIQELDDSVYFDGYSAVRLKDISSVRPDDKAEYVERALATLGRPEPTFSLSQDARTSEVLALAAANAPLVGFHLEQYDGEPLHIGQLGRLGKKRFEMLCVEANGKWDLAPERWPYKEVTQVSFGGRYYSALEAFGETPPSPE